MKRLGLVTLLALTILVPSISHASANGLVIHAFQTSGDSAYDEFVAISNDGTAPIDLTNYSVSRKTKTATTWNTLYKFTSVSIAPHQMITIAHSKYTGVYDYQYSTSYYLSNDYSIAIEEGATHVRIGTALVGTESEGDE